MSANKTQEQTKKPITICYRNIKKEFNKFAAYGEPVSSQFHLELGEKNEAKKVQDRNRDWAELHDKDVDQVGLANILKLMSRGQLGFGQTMFKDDEALDVAAIPEDINNIKPEDSSKKLQQLADQLGCSVNDLIQAYVNGTLTTLIEDKMNALKGDTKTEEKEVTE